jgi:hypothetical protein
VGRGSISESFFEIVEELFKCLSVLPGGTERTGVSFIPPFLRFLEDFSFCDDIFSVIAGT